MTPSRRRYIAVWVIVSVFNVQLVYLTYSADSDEGSGLSTKTGGAERDGKEVVGVGERNLLRGEVAFRTDDEHGVVSGRAGLAYGQRVGVVTVTDHLDGREVLLDELGERGLGVDDRQVEMERLLESADGYLVQSGAVDAGSLAVVGDKGGYLVDAYLDSLLKEPLNAVGVFRGGHGDMEMVVGASRLKGAGSHLDRAGGGVGHEDRALDQGALAVGYGDGVALSHAQRFDAMQGLFARELNQVGIKVGMEKKLHQL